MEVGRIHFLAGRHIEAVVLLEKAMHRNQDNLDSVSYSEARKVKKER